MKRIFNFSAVLATLLLAGPAFAGPITCGSAEREATLDPAEVCATGSGNPSAADVLGYWPGDPWNDVGHIDSDTTLMEGFLTIGFGDGGFDANSVDIMWEIAASFWTEYSEAVITIHVGNGGADPDHFAWLITEGALGGTLEYDRLGGGGGGFSNIVLWGRGEVTVPEPGTLALLGIGLLGLGLSRRKRV